MSKKILVTGPGQGKSFLASLLAEHYRACHIPCVRVAVSSQRDLDYLEKIDCAVVLIEANNPEVELPGIGQRIEVNGTF